MTDGRGAVSEFGRCFAEVNLCLGSKGGKKFV